MYVKKPFCYIYSVRFDAQISTRTNEESMDEIIRYADRVDTGLVFGNLNDFDAKYGHYFDTRGWINSLEEFDRNLNCLLSKTKDDDLLFICSDGHGCDPVFTGIYTREYSPLIMYCKNIKNNIYLGIDNYLNDIAATISENFGLNFKCKGKNLLKYVN